MKVNGRVSVKILVFSIFRSGLAETRLFIFMIDLFGYIHSYMKPSWAALNKNLVESREFLQEKSLHLFQGIFSLGTSLQQPVRILGCIRYKQITCMEDTSIIWRRKHYFWANMLFRKHFCKLDVQGGRRGRKTSILPGCPLWTTPMSSEEKLLGPIENFELDFMHQRLEN